MLKRLRLWLHVGLLLGLVFLLPCCGSGVQNPAGDVPALSSEAPAVGEEAAPRPQIAMVPRSTLLPFWVDVRLGAEMAAQECKVDLDWQGPVSESDSETQRNIVLNRIENKVNAIAIAPNEPGALAPVLAQAARAGIPVVSMESGAELPEVMCHVETDYFAAGQMAANVLSALVQGDGMLGLVSLAPAEPVKEALEQGFREALATAHPNIRLVSTLCTRRDTHAIANATGELLSSQPELKGLFASGELLAEGAAQALRAAGRAGEIQLVGFESGKAEIAALEEGTIQALVDAAPYQIGYLSLKAAVDALNRRPLDRRIHPDCVVLKPENVHHMAVNSVETTY